MEHKKFMDIQRIKVGITENFQVGDFIVIQEKVDGANAAIRYDSKTNTIIAQSRKNILSPENTLRGFYNFTQTLDKNKINKWLGDNIVLFGEWLVSHSVPYPDDAYNKFYVYDAYNLKTEKYFSQLTVKTLAEELGLIYIPTFYEGEFISWEHCMSYVGRTDLGGAYGEGIVVKNQTKLNNPNNRQPFYIKIVGEKFSETKAHKIKQPKSADELQAIADNTALAETIVTDTRVTKILHKLVDEGILPENWGASDMGIVAKNLPKAVVEDCIKEEPETVKQISDFGKVANKICMQIARSKI